MCRKLVLALVVTAALAALRAGTQASPGSTERVSVASAGNQGNSWSQFAALSADGRYVAFPRAASHSDAHSLSDDPTLLSRTVSAGYAHTCGVRTDGILACWGYNDSGQATPPSGTFSQVSAGGWHTCGVRTDGTLACWGYNDSGQATPPAGTFSQVSAGAYHTCGVKTDGTPACWGYNVSGQAMPPAGTFSQVSAGVWHTCGVRTDGTLACWGYNEYGQATPPTGIFSQVSAGAYHTCGVKTDGTLACWGYNVSGQATPPAGTFSQVGAGYWHTCGVRTDGTPACWGYNVSGQAMPPAGTFSQVSAGQSHTCGVRTDGTLACWGDNYYGQAAPPAGTIVIVKTTEPAGGTGFGFTDNIAAPNSFSLDDGDTNTFSNVFTDSYTVTEDDPQLTPGGFALSGLTCTDPDGGSSVDLGARKATIDLDAGETVTCTFSNTAMETPTPTDTPMPTGTPTASETPTPTATVCAGDADCDGALDGADNCRFVTNPGQENADAAIDNGPGISGNDTTIPNAVADSQGDACETDGDIDNDGLPDTQDTNPLGGSGICAAFNGASDGHPHPAGGDITNDDNHNGDAALATGTDASDNGPSWDTDNDGAPDGVECALSHNPRNRADRPSMADCGGTGDTDGDGLQNAWETCGWGTDLNVVDSDGDTLGDCKEAADVDGNSLVNFAGDTIYYAKAVLLPRAAFGNTMDFDINKNGLVDFPGDVIKEAQFALIDGLCR